MKSETGVPAGRSSTSPPDGRMAAPSCPEVFEAGAAKLRQADLDVIQHALEWAGVEFTDGDRPGVKLRKSK
jgi:hypothetical protein